MNSSRRDFLKGTAWMGAAALTAGCHLNRLGFGEGGIMQNYALRPFKRVRVGFIGIGGRGTGAVHRVAQIPGVDIVALCDKDPARVELNLKWLKERNYAGVDTIKTYVGDEGYKDLCDFGDCDVVYCATPWALHQPVALRGLLGGKIALVEVTAALTTEECWELVEASEKFRIPCMQLENCVYGEIELLELNLARLGMFGEITHVEGAYIHDLRAIIPQTGPNNNEWRWRYGENMAHRGDRYPTHGLVPLCQTRGINRGDRLDYLVALGNGPHNKNYERVRKEYLPDSDSRKFDPPAAMADMNTTLIKTVNGVSIMVQHDVSSPRPYNRKAFISGTKGAMGDYPFRCTFETKCMDGLTHKWFDEKKAADAVRRMMPFLSFAPIVFCSNKSGYNIRRTVDAIDKAAASASERLPTGMLNRVIETATKKTLAPMVRGKRLKVYYGLQVGNDPLTIRLFVNDPKLVTDAYRSYMEKAIRARFGLEGAPIRMFLKARSRKDGAALGREITNLKKNGAS